MTPSYSPSNPVVNNAFTSASSFRSVLTTRYFLPVAFSNAMDIAAHFFLSFIRINFLAAVSLRAMKSKQLVVFNSGYLLFLVLRLCE